MKTRLLARLEALGYVIGDDADPHIVADGRRIEPIPLGESRLGFALPAGCQQIALMSRTFTPAQLSAESVDLRELGLCVRRLSIDGDDFALDADALAGWNEAERACGAFSHRWTRGGARLPAGVRFVLVDIAGPGRFWRAPRAFQAARLSR